MLTKQKEDMRIAELIAVWVAKIKINNYASYFDINKASEGLALQLLNLVYDYELVDLNHEAENYPGIDLGDQTKAEIGIQVTSRTDNSKINSTLSMFNKKNYLSSFPKGLKIFMLSTDSVNRDRKAQIPFNRFFSYKDGIITPSSLMRDINRCADDVKRTNILSLLERQLGHTSYIETTLQDLMAKISTTSEANLQAIGHLLAERTRRRIDRFIALEQDSWQHGYTRGTSEEEDYLNKFLSLYKLEQDHQTKIEAIITTVQDGSAVKFLFDEYLELEKTQFSMLTEVFTKGQYQILMSTGKSFQFMLRSLLDALIEKYNENLTILSTYFHIDASKIENGYKTVNEVIHYRNLSDKQAKLTELLDMRREPSALYVFLDSKENLSVVHQEYQMVIELYGDQMNMSEINQTLVAILETVSVDGKVFSGFKYRDNVIFLTPVDNETKKALSMLQQRSYFGIYYFEKH